MFFYTVHFQVALSNILKFQYIKGLFSEKTSSLTKHIPLSNEYYQEACKTMLDGYEKRKRL